MVNDKMNPKATHFDTRLATRAPGFAGKLLHAKPMSSLGSRVSGPQMVYLSGGNSLSWLRVGLIDSNITVLWRFLAFGSGNVGMRLEVCLGPLVYPF